MALQQADLPFTFKTSPFLDYIYFKLYLNEKKQTNFSLFICCARDAPQEKVHGFCFLRTLHKAEAQFFIYKAKAKIYFGTSEFLMCLQLSAKVVMLGTSG